MKRLSKALLGVLTFFMISGNLFAETMPVTDKDDITLYFVRHGKTMFNALHRVQGWSDSPLTEKGRSDAALVAKGLSLVKFDIIYTSDLGRARETAHIIQHMQKTNPLIIEDAGLREWNYGGYEGGLDGEMWKPIFQSHNLQYDEAFTQWDQLMSKMTDREVANEISRNDPEKWAENYQQIESRLKTAVDRIVERARKNNVRHVLIVSHGGAIGTIVDILSPQTKPVPLIDNMSVTTFSYHNMKYSLLKVGDMSYYRTQDNAPLK